MNKLTEFEGDLWRGNTVFRKGFKKHVREIKTGRINAGLRAESDANAALIVRAINEHAALCAVEEAARSAGAFPELTAALSALSAVREGGAK